MNTRLPPEYAGELFFKADVENMPYPILPPEGAVDLLTKACTMLGQVRFDWAYIERPKEGSVFVVMLNGDDVPHDGYQYMDDEVTYNFTSETGKRMIIQERQQGFIPGDQFTHIARRRYKLVNIGKDNVVLLHYTRADESRKVLVDPRMAKTMPRNYPLKPLPSAVGAPGQPIAYPQQQPGMPGYRPPFPAQQQPQPQVPQQMKSPAGINVAKGGSPYGASPGAPGSPGAAAAGQQAGYGRFQPGVPAQIPGQPIQQPPQPTGAPQRLASINGGRKQSHKKQANPQATLQAQLQHQQMLAQQQEDAEEPSGDELDFLTTRDVAIARYKRNHDYMAEVFSPYPATAIIPNQYDYQQSIEFFKTLQGRHGDDLDELKQNHDEKIKKFKADAEVFYRGMLELKQATTVQEVVTANERVESFVGAKVLPYSFLRRTELPTDEASKTPELRAKPASVPPIPVLSAPELGSMSTSVEGSDASQPATADTSVSLLPAITTNDATPATVTADNAAPAVVAADMSATTAIESPAVSTMQAEPAAITPITAAPTGAISEPSAMDIDSKPQDSNSDTTPGMHSSSDMQVDNAPSSASVLQTGAHETGASSVPTAAGIDIVPSSGPSSVITHEEDHVMTEAPALASVETEPAVVPAPAPAPAPVSAPEPVAPEPAPVHVSPPLSTHDASQMIPDVTVAVLPGVEQSATTTESSAIETFGQQADDLTNPTSSEGVSHATTPALPGGEAAKTLPTVDESLSKDGVATTVPEQLGHMGIEEPRSFLVNPVQEAPAIPEPTPTPVSEPEPVATSAETSVDAVSTLLPEEPSPVVEESTPQSSTVNLDAAGSHDSSVEVAQDMYATTATKGPAASLVMEKTVVAPTTAEAEEGTVVSTKDQLLAGDPHH
ncbi:hypothetical protein BGZ73_002566 [Actinomortierella ambigua]|nr:hypothetical protein BGZ73_002566 [Actinomortierella ambigua]